MKKYIFVIFCMYEKYFTPKQTKTLVNFAFIWPYQQLLLPSTYIEFLKKIYKKQKFPTVLIELVQQNILTSRLSNKGPRKRI